MPNLDWRKKIYLSLKSPRTAWNTVCDKFTGIKNNEFPRLIDLFVTERCNFTCPMCHVKESMRNNSTAGDLEFTYIEKIIEESREWSPCFQIIGGEPTLYKRILDLIELISSNKMICGLTTNGLLLEGFAQGFVDRGLNFLAVSLDGWDEDSQKKRGNVSGSFDRILKGIKEVIKYKGKRIFPIIRIATVITKNNCQHLAKIWDIISNLEIDTWSISNYYFVTDNVLKANKEFYGKTRIGDSIWGDKVRDNAYFSGDEIKIIEANLERIKIKQTGIKVDYNWALKLTDFYSPKFPGKESKCALPYNELLIRGNGNMELCQGYKLGNIASDTIEGVWQGERIKYFRGIFERNKIMPACFRCCALNMKF